MEEFSRDRKRWECLLGLSLEPKEKKKLMMMKKKKKLMTVKKMMKMTV